MRARCAVVVLAFCLGGAAFGAENDDFAGDPAEPDYSVITLPTNLRLPSGRLALLMTHRFARPLGAGSFGDLASDLFGLDSGAQIGIGLRFGLLRATQVTLYRTSDRTIQLGVQRELLAQGHGPLGLSIVPMMEGRDNFSKEYSPSVALVVSRKLGQRGALYAAPAWVGNTRYQAGVGHDSTLLLGLGARVMLDDSSAVLAEAHPRLAGYDGARGSGPSRPLLAFGLERQVGGHVFQLNVSNDLGTTPAQIARGHVGSRDWYIGFNLTRRFF